MDFRLQGPEIDFRLQGPEIDFRLQGPEKDREGVVAGGLITLLEMELCYDLPGK